MLNRSFPASRSDLPSQLNVELISLIRTSTSSMLEEQKEEKLVLFMLCVAVTAQWDALTDQNTTSENIGPF